MTEAPKLLRVVFDSSKPDCLLRTFAVYEGDGEDGKMLANGYTGPGGTTVALMARPSEWHQLPDRDVLAAMRGFFRMFPNCEITVQEPEPQPENNSCIAVRNALGRWIIVNAKNPSLAWSGSNWVAHERGVGVRVQVANFGCMRDAVVRARENGFDVEIESLPEEEKGGAP
jgi:hypothetical protein